MSIEGICNQALDLIGYPRHIGNIYEGTKAARVALGAWGRTRDLLLKTTNPDWARKDGTLVLSKSAPNIVNGTASYNGAWTNALPPIPWLYEYLWPDDCVEPLRVKSTPATVPIWRPRPTQVRQMIDTSTHTILTNEPNAILVYIFKVTDPDLWHEDFQTLMVEALAKIFSTELGERKANAGADNSGRSDQRSAG
jgi:hypothetical protein